MEGSLKLDFVKEGAGEGERQGREECMKPSFAHFLSASGTLKDRYGCGGRRAGELPHMMSASKGEAVMEKWT